MSMELEKLERPLPSNPNAERAVLGAMLLDDRGTVEVLAAGLRAEHFFLPDHRVIYRTIELLHAQGSKADLVTLVNLLTSAGDLEKAGGAGHIASLIDGVPRVSNVGQYASIVLTKAKLRGLIHYADNLKRRAFEETESNSQLLEDAVSNLLNIADDGGGLASARPWKEVSTSALAEIQRAVLHPEKIKRIRFGLTDLDDMTGGLRPGELVLLVAPTSHGKTLLAAQGTFQADRDGFKTLFFSAEMPAEEVILREISFQAGVKFHFVRRPERLQPGEYQRLVDASHRECSVRVVDRDITPTRIWAMTEAAKRTHGLDLVVVDYDQLVVEAGMNPDLQDENIFRHQRNFIIRAKRLARQLDITFLLLCQLRKLSPAVLKGAAPNLDDIWGDSSMRNTPQIILWASRDFFTRKMDKAYERKARVYVLKGRNNRTGIVPLEFDPDYVRFLDQPPTEENSTPEICSRRK